jgi:hypothetical protein
VRQLRRDGDEPLANPHLPKRWDDFGTLPGNGISAIRMVIKPASKIAFQGLARRQRAGLDFEGHGSCRLPGSFTLGDAGLLPCCDFVL